jgi:hypothetical protein
MASGSLKVYGVSGVAAGLVHTSTSDTRFAFKKTISDEEKRVRRLQKMKQNVITSARLHSEETRGFRGKWAMLTLTYREDVSWAKYQITELVKRVREYCRRAGFDFRYVWVFELTKRLRPHYHMLIWLPNGRTLPKPDKRGWWMCGWTRIEWARNVVGYVAKYGSKGIDGDSRMIPSGARLSGFGGLSKRSRVELRWWKLSRWLRECWPDICDVVRVKGGFLNRDTGEFTAGVYRVVWFGGCLCLFKKG